MNEPFHYRLSRIIYMETGLYERTILLQIVSIIYMETGLYERLENLKLS